MSYLPTLSDLTRHYGFLALVALGGILIGVALGTEELLVLSGEGLVHQGVLALEALEAVLVPVAVLVGQILPRTEGGTRQAWPTRAVSTHSSVHSLPWSCSRWTSCSPRRCWSTGSRNTSHSRDSPLSGHTSSQTGTPCSSGSHNAQSF